MLHEDTSHPQSPHPRNLETLVETFLLAPNLAKLEKTHGGDRPPVLKWELVKWGILGAPVVMVILNPNLEKLKETQGGVRSPILKHAPVNWGS